MKLSLPPIGPRMLKTALSVSVCMLLARAFSYPPPVFACVAAIIVTRETVEVSFRMGVVRVLATLIGGAIALLYLLFDPGLMSNLEILFVGIGVLVTLYCCLLMKAPDAAALACVTFLIIVLRHSEDKYLFALTRVGETVVGICVSLLINRLIRPPKSCVPDEAVQTIER